MIRLLDLLFVLQELSRPIKKDKVDLMAIYNQSITNCPIRSNAGNFPIGSDPLKFQEIAALVLPP